MNPKIGLFGGTFDPPHNGHLRMAQAFAHELALDAVRFLPAGDPYHKNPAQTSAEHRLQMCRAAVRGRRGMTADDVDIRRNGSTYTYDTLRLLRAKEPQTEFWWLLGGDSLHTLHRWHAFDKLFSLTHFAVASRTAGDTDIARLPEAVRPWIVRGLAAEENAPAGKVHFLHLAPLDISSSAVRAKLAAGQDVRADIPAEVADYIRRHGLYTGAGETV